MLEGEKVILDAIEKEDLKKLLEWRNNPELRKYFREYRELNESIQEKWFIDKIINSKNDIMFAIREKKNMDLIGCCGLANINWIFRHAEHSLYIGLKSLYIDTIGYSDESCQLLFEYGFNQLNLNKIWAEIYEFDEKKFSLYKKLGFKQDGALRQHYFYDGRWWTSLILSLLAGEYGPDRK